MRDQGNDFFFGDEPPPVPSRGRRARPRYQGHHEEPWDQPPPRNRRPNPYEYEDVRPADPWDEPRRVIADPRDDGFPLWDDEPRPPRRPPPRKGGRRGRRRRRRKGRAIAPMLAIIVLIAFLGIGGYFGFLWLRQYVIPPDYDGQGTGEVTVAIMENQTATDVGNTLVKLDVVASVRAFTKAISAARKDNALQPGKYKLRKRMAAAEAVKLLDPALRVTITVLIKEGLRLGDVLRQLAKQTRKPYEDFEKAAKKPAELGLPDYAGGKLEGFLFPNTYDFDPSAEPRDVLKEMVRQFTSQAGVLGVESEAERLKLKPKDVIIIASLVQAESGRKEDMKKIARVVYNRLRSPAPMNKLQFDSTVMFALKKYGIAATEAETRTPSPYNTYLHAGLPPGPICSPGADAIKAVLRPAQGNWLYFVTTDPKRGITKFTADYQEFLRFKEEFQKNSGRG